jgi:hypothetical protein
VIRSLIDNMSAKMLPAELVPIAVEAMCKMARGVAVETTGGDAIGRLAQLGLAEVDPAGTLVGMILTTEPSESGDSHSSRQSHEESIGVARGPFPTGCGRAGADDEAHAR